MNKKMISLEIQDDLREALRIKAFAENLSVSKLIRKILESALEDELSNVRKDINDRPEG